MLDAIGIRTDHQLASHLLVSLSSVDSHFQSLNFTKANLAIALMATSFFSLILGSFVALCLLSHFVKNRFLSNFSITDNYRIIHQHGPNINESSAFLHGTKFILTALSITTHVTGLPLAIFYSHPFGELGLKAL